MTTKTSPKYTVSLKMGDGNKVYKGAGSDFAEALSTIEMPEKLIERGVLTVTNGKKIVEQVFTPFQLRGLRSNALSKEILAKRLSVLLK